MNKFCPYSFVKSDREIRVSTLRTYIDNRETKAFATIHSTRSPMYLHDGRDLTPNWYAIATIHPQEYTGQKTSQKVTAKPDWTNLQIVRLL